jgi:serine phosphatase RsbU (regulator of sigma subunit)
MSCSNMIICSLDASRDVAEDFGARLAWHWGDGAAPKFVALGPEAFAEPLDESVDAVLLLAADAATHKDAAKISSRLDDDGVPVVILCDKAHPPLVCEGLVESIEAAPDRLCAILRGLLHEHRRVSELRRELAFRERFHGGLRGEISKMHEELQLAAMVQQEFLPRELPCLHGVSFGALWRPAHYVSGDIYEVARLDEDHVGFFIADAVGHGVPAALMTMVICRSLLPKEVEGNTYRLIPPSEVLARLNDDMIRRRSRSSRFATAVYATLNCRTREMTIAGAGHPPPLLLHEDGSVDEIETSGGLLGVFADELYGQVEVKLGAGDSVLLYSDGFEQAFPRAESQGYEQRLPTTQYLDEFRQLAALDDPSRMVKAIADRVDVQRGSLHPTDDLTLVCAHVGTLAHGRENTPDHVTGHSAVTGVEAGF